MTAEYLALISSLEFLKEVKFETKEQVEDCIKFLFTRNLLFEDELNYLLTKIKFMSDEIKNDLLKQKADIEAKGRFKGKELELEINTWVVTRNDRRYSSGAFGFSDPDEMTKRDAEALAFHKSAKAVSAKVYWGKKYQTILDALSRF